MPFRNATAKSWPDPGKSSKHVPLGRFTNAFCSDATSFFLTAPSGKGWLSWAKHSAPAGLTFLWIWWVKSTKARRTPHEPPHIFHTLVDYAARALGKPGQLQMDPGRHHRADLFLCCRRADIQPARR